MVAPAKSSQTLVSMVWATLGGYSWSDTATAASPSARTKTWHMYSASLTDWRAPADVRSTRILEVKVMKSWAVPRWKKLMLERSKPVCKKETVRKVSDKKSVYSC